MCSSPLVMCAEKGLIRSVGAACGMHKCIPYGELTAAAAAMAAPGRTAGAAAVVGTAADIAAAAVVGIAADIAAAAVVGTAAHIAAAAVIGTAPNVAVVLIVYAPNTSAAAAAAPAAPGAAGDAGNETAAAGEIIGDGLHPLSGDASVAAGIAAGVCHKIGKPEMVVHDPYPPEKNVAKGELPFTT